MNRSVLNLSRRTVLHALGGLVKGAGLAGVLLAIKGLLGCGTGSPHTSAQRVHEKSEFVFRPPGSRAEPLFLARCIHCYLCQDVCPAGCIHMQQDGAADRYTPYLVPRIKGCTLCLKCGDVCPTGALTRLHNKEQVRIGFARVDESLCVSHLRTGVCGACFTACPLRGKAITQGLYNAPTVHREHCTGCGLCEEVCIVAYRAIRVYPNTVMAGDDRGGFGA